MDKLITEVNIT